MRSVGTPCVVSRSGIPRTIITGNALLRAVNDTMHLLKRVRLSVGLDRAGTLTRVEAHLLQAVVVPGPSVLAAILVQQPVQ